MIKLLAGSYSVQVNQKSHGGYTPLHLACQFGHQEVFDILVKAYGADPHLRDNSGRKPSKWLSLKCMRYYDKSRFGTSSLKKFQFI